MELHIQRLNADIPLPSFAKKGDAALDLRAAEQTELLPGERKAIPTGMKIALPENHVGMVKDRGSVSFHRGLHCLAGVFDSGYRGEWKVVMVNLGKETVVLEKGERIAQVLIIPLAQVDVIEKASLDETERSETGFGSSGKF